MIDVAKVKPFAIKYLDGEITITWIDPETDEIFSVATDGEGIGGYHASKRIGGTLERKWRTDINDMPGLKFDGCGISHPI